MQHIDFIGRITNIKTKSDINIKKKSSKTKETQMIPFVSTPGRKGFSSRKAVGLGAEVALSHR